MYDLDIPTIPDSCSHQCKAVRHIEDLAHEMDELRREVRQCERHHTEDLRKVWMKIGVLMAALAAAVPSGWALFLGVI